MGMPSHKHLTRLGGVLVLALCAWTGFDVLTVTTVHAAPTDIFDAGLQANIASIVSQFVQYLNIGTWVLFTLLTQLLDPQVIFDMKNGGGLMTMLNQIWQLSRDLMNVLFAFMLVIAALYTVIKADKSFVSENMSKFVMAVILVNFSWFFPRVVLDIANVATSTVYGIPSLLATDCKQVLPPNWVNVGGAPIPFPPKDGINCTPNGANNQLTYSCSCVVINNVHYFPNEKEIQQRKGAGWKCDAAPLLCYQQVPLNTNTMSSITTTLNGLVVNHGRLQALASMPTPIGGGNVSEMITFIVREIIVLVFAIALFFPLLALVVAFLVRIPILWITIAFMPFYFLSYLPFMDKILKDFSPKDKIMDNFVSAAFMPAITAVPIAIGYTMVNAAMMMPPGPLNQINFPLISQIQNFYQLVWLCMALGILWVGVFTALESSKFSKKFTEKIRDQGKTLGSIAMKVPMAAPLPIPGGASLMQMGKIPKQIEQLLGEKDGLRKAKDFVTGGDVRPNKEARDKLAKGLDTDDRRKDFKKKADEATKNPDGVKKLLIEIKDKHGVNVEEDHLSEFLKNLQEQNKINLGLSASELKLIDEKAKELKAAKAKPVASTTTTPPAPPAAPAAPATPPAPGTTI
jgi:hypothetical protein